MFTKEALQEKRASLSAEKQALLLKRLRGELPQNGSSGAIPRRPDNGPAPLSFAQERMWFLYALEPDSPTYNESATSRIQGKLDLDAMLRAYKEVVRRHEILRTTFQVMDDQPVQIVSPVPDDLAFRVVDLTHLPEAERLAQATRVVETERQRPFDLAHEFPWRTLLILLAPDDVIISLTQHHIACDGWSITIFKSELGKLYKAYSEGQSLTLPELPLQYADFAHWERQTLQNATQGKDLAYWRQQLEGLTTLQMPTDRPRPPIATTNGTTYYSYLSLDLVEAMEKVSQERGVTEFMKYLAAFQVLLHRYTGQTDITVGSTIANRNRPELENIIGFFLNTLVLRTDLSGDPTYHELLQRTRETALGAFAHQDLPIDYLVTQLPFERDPSRNPLFQILFIWQDWGRMSANQSVPDLEASMTGVDALTGRAKFDITLSMEKKEQGVNCCWEYNTDLFDAETIERMAQHLETLLRGIVANCEQAISHLPLLAETEQQQLIAWNDTAVPFPQDHCIHDLFAAQVAQTPEAIALIAGEQTYTYAALNRRANQLAHHLQRLGVGPEQIVGLSVERSPEMIIGVLGILKAGAAYLPLDPDYPPDRLAYMLQDAAVSVLLTGGQPLPLADALAHQPTIIHLTNDWPRIAQEAENNPPTAVQPHNLAYVIYTSGSTGQPKGVMVPHQSLANYSHVAQHSFALGPGQRMLQFATLNFDTAAEEIYPTLISGATLVLRANELDSVPHFLAQCQAWGITILDLPTAYWHEIVAALKAEADDEATTLPDSLRLVIIGGERALPERFQAWQQLVGTSVQLLNTYGPTETTIVATMSDLGQFAAYADPAADLPIGRPVANLYAYVLDPQGQLAPIGVPGELCIGGVGVTRGYLNRPGLTAVKFTPDPFSTQPGARLYHTGDLARYRPDGRLEFLGRIDHQVKIRGFRVEPGEIETTLVQHPAVQDAIVLVHTDPGGHNQLAAYIVPAGELAIAELRHFAQEKLPAYMIPAAFILLEELPLTPSGKVDRRALAHTGLVQFQRQEEFIPPQDDIEKQIAAIWEEVLAVKPIGINDNFFTLGGHSLLAIRIIAHIRRALQTDISLRALFEKPTIAELAADIRRQEKSGLEMPPIRPLSREEPLPLSFAQQRLWFLYQLQPESAIYTIPLAMRITGALDVDALARTLSEIVRRHEALRTAFVMGTDEPVQMILPPTAVPLPLIDLQHLSPTAQEIEVRQRATAEAQRPFDLTTGPLLRGTLLQLAAADYVFLLTLDHIVFDEWSMDILGREMATIYQAILKGQTAALPELPVQYADYAVWQRTWLQGEMLDSQLDYWRGQLAGAPPVLELPTDRPRPPMQTYSGAMQTFMLPGALAAPLQALSQQEGTTLFITCLAAFKALLARYSGQHDLVVGSPIANRNQAEVEDLIGFFLNTLALRTDLSGNPTFRELLARVRETTLAAYAHQELPFEKLVEELQPERNLSTSPFFQVMFVFHNRQETTHFGLPGVQLQPLPVDGRRARFDLTLYLEETGQGYKGELEYNTDLFDAATIEQMGQHFTALVEHIVANPDARLLDIPLLSDAEQTHLLHDWNANALSYDTTATLASLVAEQTARTPDAVALRYEQEQWSYTQLNGQANQLAHHLQSLGVGPESRVGILLERRPEMVVALLATLKAGGAYVPLDPAYPPERLAYILQDADTAVLLTHDALRFPLDTLDLAGVKVVNLSQEWPDEAETGDPVTAVSPHNLAYTIYTSGSTGQPKGVAITHANAVALLAWARELFSDEELAGVLAATSICFDLSVFELFLPLSCGGSVILAQNALHLPELPDRDFVTLVNTVPSAMRELVAHSQLPPSVQTVNLAGEPLTRALSQQVYTQPQVARLYNLYGPSEDTTYSTWLLVERDEAGEPSIGRPIANTQAYILDEQMQPVPLGVVGELYLGGDGVSRGYLNRPGLTAEKYVPDPFSPQPGARLYQTGDLARYGRDGQMEFLGRRDHQVKIRGYRIELGEIEAVLAQHPAIAEVVVMAQPDEQGGKQLVAYLVAKPEQTLALEAIRPYLQSRLPDYMVPTVLMPLATLPQTPNGKIDRRALPVPTADRSPITAAYVPPRTAMEEKVAEIWADVLGVARVGAFDNFFELGGHSLLAVRIIARLRQALQIELPMRLLFESATVASLALALETAVHQNTIPVIVPASRDGELPLSFAQQRLWFLEQLDPGSASYNMPFAMIIKGTLDVAILERSLNEVVRRHEILRTTFQAVDGRPLQIVQPELALTIPVIDLRQLPAAERDAAAQQTGAQEAGRPFDLTQGPLLRATLMHLEDEEYGLILNLHHILADEWSLDILGQEIITLYRAFLAERPSPLPPLPVQYADYAVWQREWLQGETLATQLDYWRQQLQDAPARLELPTDRPRPAVQTAHGATLDFTIPADVAAVWQQLSQQEGGTLFMTLLAAFQVLLHRYSGQNHITVGSPIANRNQVETEGLIGFFVNTLVFHTDLSGNPSFRQLLARVKEVALGAYAYQELPFEKLVEELQPERDLSHHPLFQVMFTLQNAKPAPPAIPGLRFEPLVLANETAKFDLTLALTETAVALTGSLEYNTDLFDASTAERLIGHFQQLLQNLAAHPDRPISELSILSQVEKEQLLIAWNDTAVPLPICTALHHLVEAQVNRTPEATAVQGSDHSLSYAELNRRANQLARYLQRLGIGPESRVGVLMERSPDMVVALLGILKAGGAYLPLDPAYPAERLAYILEDAAAAVLITDEELPLPVSGLPLLNLSREWSAIAQEAESNLDTAVSPTNLAYLIYTSGSTGLPKGVMISHQAVVNYVRVLNQKVGLTAADKLLQFASISFDVAVEEIFTTLASGATLVLREKEMLSSVAHFLHRCEALGITILDLPTAYWHELAAILSPESLTLPASLRLVIIGGERALPEPFRLWQTAVGQQAQLLNTYGPTEATIAATASDLTTYPPDGRELPIGRPFGNLQTYILDEHGQPTPVGVPGELHIGGIGVGRGYWQRPRLTAVHFIPDPFSAEPGARLYRTGDLARYRPDGQIEYLGRRDHQVKIRGFRVELGEIEAALITHPGVTETAVLALDDGRGYKQLVAYVVAATDSPPETAPLRAHLAEILPAYMIPAIFIPLEKLPLTPSGKIDRKALPLPDQARPDDQPYVAPRTDTEITMTAIWAEVLRLEKVGIYDNFFTLGGHSLIGTQLMSRIRDAFQVELPLRLLFETPDVASLVEHVEIARWVSKEPAPVDELADYEEFSL